MSSCDRRSLLAGLGWAGLRLGGLGLGGLGLGTLALAGCGLTPVHAPGGTGRALRGAVRAADPVSRADYQFVAALEDLLGRPGPARFDLAYRIAVQRIEAGRVQGLGATRSILAGSVDYTLAEAGLERARGRVAAEAVYSTTATQLATQTAAEDAELRLMRMLADSLVSRLLADPQLAA
jgi:LPS-assembly lipoprotein